MLYSQQVFNIQALRKHIFNYYYDLRIIEYKKKIYEQNK